MKFSMKETAGRYNLSQSDVLFDWIIKTPSTKHKFVPLNESTAMLLAALAGVEWRIFNHGLKAQEFPGGQSSRIWMMH